MDAQRNYPSREIPLELIDKTVWFQKMEVHKGIYWYSTEPNSSVNLTAVTVARVREIQQLNRKGVKPDKLILNEASVSSAPVSEDLLKNNSLTRFDTKAPGRNQQQNSPRRKNRRFNDKRNK